MNAEKSDNKNLAAFYDKFISCLKIELLGFTRKKIFYVGLLAYIAFSFYFFLVQGLRTNILHAVYNTQVIQIITMALMGALGIQMGGSEHNCNYFEAMSALNKGKRFKLGAKITTSLILATGSYLIIGIASAILGIMQNCALSVIINCLQFLFLRIFLPAFIFAIIGIAIGYQIKSQFKYAVWLLVTFLFSPIFPNVHGYIFIALNSNSSLLEYLLNMLELGSVGDNISEVYGMPIEFPFWIHMLFMTAAAAAYCIVIYSGRYFNFKRNLSVTALFIVGAASVFCLSYNDDSYTFFVNYGHNLGRSSVTHDMESVDKYYYLKGGNIIEESIPYNDMVKGSYITPVAWDVTLKPGAVMLNTEAELEAVAEEATDWQSFTLYHNYRIKEISVNGSKAEFKRNGNYVSVKMPDGMSKGDTVKIKFAYSGLSSPLEQGNRYIVSLTSDFPWLPGLDITELPEDSFDENAYLKLYGAPQKFENAVKYTLRFKSNYVVYTNIEEVSDGLYEGSSDTGLTVVAYGLQAKTEIDGVTVYYPQSIKQDLDIHTELYKLSRTSLKEFFTAIGIEEIPESFKFKENTIVFIPSSFYGEYANREFYILDNTYVGYYCNAGLIAYDRMIIDDFGINNYAESVAEQLIDYDLTKLKSMEYGSTDYFIYNYMMHWYLENYSGSLLDSSYVDSTKNSDGEIFQHLTEIDEYSENSVANKLLYLEKEGRNDVIREFFKNWYIDRASGKYYSDEQAIEKINNINDTIDKG